LFSTNKGATADMIIITSKRLLLSGEILIILNSTKGKIFCQVIIIQKEVLLSLISLSVLRYQLCLGQPPNFIIIANKNNISLISLVEVIEVNRIISEAIVCTI